jgi:hypothetical protein
MNLCPECGKGFCLNRVRKLYGHIAGGYCSPGCASAKTEMAGRIFDELTVQGFISDDIAGDEDKYAEAVKVIVPHLKAP